MNKSHTIPILVLSTIVTLASVFLFVFFWKVIDNKNQHISAVLTTLQGKMKEKEDARIFAGKVSEIKTIQNSINDYFVDPDAIDKFVGYLEGVGLDLGSKISVGAIDIPDKTKNIISIKLSIVGPFDNVMKSIAFLENIPYQVNISQIYLNENTKKEVQDFDVKTKTQPKAPKIPTWQADVSFNILSLN